MRKVLFDILVITEESLYVKGTEKGIVMIPFSGTVKGDYFTGKVVGPGVDTQTICGEEVKLSARYMLEGTDCEGNACRVFVENNGDFVNGFFPNIVTDSPVLQKFDNKKLQAVVQPKEEGVVIQIFTDEE